jgi:hypothetical protein
MPRRHWLRDFSELARQIVEQAASACARNPGAIARHHTLSGAGSAPTVPSVDAAPAVPVGLLRLYALWHAAHRPQSR